MKQLFIKIAALFAFALISFYGIASLADGYTDSYYAKFTSGKHHSTILGNSKSLHGIIPYVLDSMLQTEYPSLQIFNYGFSLGHSAFGPVYYRAIEKKLDTRRTDGLFIICVDPWGISSVKDDPENPDRFVEKESFLGKLTYFNASPNLDYLARGYTGAWGNIILNRLKGSKSIGFLHNNGWLEVSVTWDSLTAERNIGIFEKLYRDQYLPGTAPSALRLHYLEKTIELLQPYGKIYLVRMPVHKRLKCIDELVYPDFDKIMARLSFKKGVPYLNLVDSNRNYMFNDGVHLNRLSGRQFSTSLSSIISSSN